MKKLVLYLITLACLCGCTPIKTDVPLVPPLPTSTLVDQKSKTPMALIGTPVGTPTPYIQGLVFSLPQGEYLVTGRHGSDSQTWIMDFYFPDGTLAATYPRILNDRYASQLSPSMEYFFDNPILFNLSTGEITQPSPSRTSCYNVVWSPDSRYFTIACSDSFFLYSGQEQQTVTLIYSYSTSPASWSPDSNAFIFSGSNGEASDLFLYSLGNETLTQITDTGENSYATDSALWSPNGDWIAYYYRRVASGRKVTDGLHIMDARCLTAPSTCLVNEPGLATDPPYTWSPDSQYLAGRAEDGYIAINMYQVQNGQAMLTQTINIGSYISRIAFSPKGQWIAAKADNGVYVIDVSNGTTTQISNAIDFYSWVLVP